MAIMQATIQLGREIELPNSHNVGGKYESVNIRDGSGHYTSNSTFVYSEAGVDLYFVGDDATNLRNIDLIIEALAAARFRVHERMQPKVEDRPLETLTAPEVDAVLGPSGSVAEKDLDELPF